MSAKILCVDDEINILDGYKRGLRKHFEIDTAQGGEEGLRLMASDGPYAVVVSDMRMPGMNGIQFLAAAKGASPDTVRMMLTGNADLQTAMSALNEGSIFRFLMKPFSNDNMAQVLEAGVAQYRLVTAEKELLEKTLRGSVRILIEILSTINPELFGKAQTMRQEMRQIAEALGIAEVWGLELAAMLSHIGIVTLPHSIVAKIEKNLSLTPSEQTLADKIPQISYSLLANIPRLEVVAQVIRDQNRAYDAAVPANATILVGSRILRLLNDLHAMEKRGVSRAGAIAMMRHRVTEYDPVVLEAATRCFCQTPEVFAMRRPAMPVRIANLRLGHVLAADLETEDGMLLVAAGRQITATLLEKITNYAELAEIREPIFVERPLDHLARRAA